ncbi:hypothetical protein BD779DRAFT_657371 [Infundibulicybe gibba]|nr:hypothetical protein BD779DRAFT_657371 [Infundibulicybe gibba]
MCQAPICFSTPVRQISWLWCAQILWTALLSALWCNCNPDDSEVIWTQLPTPGLLCIIVAREPTAPAEHDPRRRD